MNTKPIDLGLPANDVSAVRLVFEPTTCCVGLQWWIAADSAFWGRVYWRRPGEVQYALATNPGDGGSDSELCVGGRYLFFLRTRGRNGRSGWAFDSEAIGRVELPSGEVVLWSLKNLRLPRDAVVSRLFGASLQGDTIYADVGSPTSSGEYSYAITAIRLDGAGTEALVPLVATFV